MWLVVGEREVLGPEIKNVFDCRIKRDSGEMARLACQQFFYFVVLALIHMDVGEGIDHVFQRISEDLPEHHTKCRVLDHVERHSDGEISASLEMVDRKLAGFRKYEYVYPAVARRYDDFALELRMLERILRDPWGDKVRAQIRPLADLLDEIFDLIKRLAFAGGECRPCGAIRAVAKIAFGKPEDVALFAGYPRLPPLAAKCFKLFLGARAVQKRDMFGKGSGKHTARKIALGDDRESVGKRVAQLLSHEHARFFAVNGRDLGAFLKNLAEEVLILGVRCTLLGRFRAHSKVSISCQAGGGQHLTYGRNAIMCRIGERSVFTHERMRYAALSRCS